MTTNKKILFGSIFLSILIISIIVTLKIVNNYHNNQYKSIEKTIIYYAKKCYYDEVCKDNKITLKQLYDNKYIESIIYDPISKKAYDDSIYVLIENEKVTFHQ